MTDGSVIVAIVGVGVGLLAVLVPLLLTLAAGIRREVDQVRGELAELRRDLHAVSERVARIEGALTGPWRPANGGRSGPIEATVEEPTRED